MNGRVHAGQLLTTEVNEGMQVSGVKNRERKYQAEEKSKRLSGFGKTKKET